MRGKVIISPYRWAGSKRQLLNELIETFEDADIYVEPFLGSGIVMLNVLKIKDYQRIYVNDKNINIISFYRNLQSFSEKTISAIRQKEEFYNKLKTIEEKEKYYYEKRMEFNTIKNKENIESSSIFWFLMKAGYNGVYRINNSGNYNVPFGKKKSIECNHKNLIIISEQIKDVIFYNEDYSIFLKKLIIENPRKTLFVYADPPYIGNSNGNIYSKNIFDHNELVNTLKKLKKTKFAISMEKSLESDKIFKNLEENNLKNVIRKINPNKIIKKDEFLYTNYTIKSNKIRESYEF